MIRPIFFLVVFLFSAVWPSLAQKEEEKKSSHFIVYYSQGVPDDFVDTVLEFAERYYNELTQKLGFTRFDYWTWDNRAKITIYPDQETYVAETKQPSWSGGIASYSEKAIWTYPRGAGFFDSLLPHEIGHIVFREVIGSRKVPLWLEEGVASFMEQAKRFGSQRLILDAIRDNTFIPFQKLQEIDGVELRGGGVDIPLYYAEAVHLVAYLLDHFGIPRFNDFCRKLREGKKFDVALSYAYFDIRSTDDLGKLWEESLMKKVKTRNW